jgi:hypothetical protein
MDEVGSGDGKHEAVSYTKREKCGNHRRLKRLKIAEEVDG